MNKEEIIKARNILDNELSNSLKELGTDWFHRLSLIRGELDILISILDDTNAYNKRQKMFK